jgi:hypothetical protein
MSMMPKLFVVAALTGAVICAAPRASADPSAADLLVARQLGTEGIELAQQGDCGAALLKLERAEAIHHAPSLLLKIGECQTKLGRHVDALSSLDRVAHEKLGPNPPHAFVVAQERAAALIEEVRPKVGTLRVDTSGPRAGVLFRLDQGELKPATLGLDRLVDPGTHVIEATTSDGHYIRREIDVAQGTREAVTLDLPAPEGPNASGAPRPLVPVSDGPNMRTVGWALTGAGAAGLLTSAIFAGVTLSKKASLDDACTGKACPPSSRSDYDSATTTATVTGIALVVGVVALGAGIFILVTRKTDRIGALPAWVQVASGRGLSF